MPSFLINTWSPLNMNSFGSYLLGFTSLKPTYNSMIRSDMVWKTGNASTIIGLKILYLIGKIKGNLLDRQLCLVYVVSCFEK